MESKGYDYHKKCEICDTLLYIRKSLKVRSLFSTKYKQRFYPEKSRFCSRKCTLYWRNVLENPMKKDFVKNKISGKNNYAWLGKNVKYFGLHSWIRRKIGGRPEKCQHCGIAGFENKNKRWSIQFCNFSGKYKRELSDWVMLCVSCHRKHDNSKRKINKFKCLDCKDIIKTKFSQIPKFCRKCKRRKHNQKT